MKILLFSLLFCPALIFAQSRAENYPVDAAAVEHQGVPKGELLHFKFEKSIIYPGTFREYWLYVPAQYNPSKPACVFVMQDGLQFNAPTVFDNLINSKEMPVTIGVFIMPGRVPAADTSALDRYNRSFEYDGLGEQYARFLLEEMLPEVEKQKTSDGRAIVLSKNGNDRAIGGLSSGAICAFNAAWERPNEFSRVFSAIGTFVDLRGGGIYPSLIRKFEPKPIRVFLQDGTGDLNIYGGNWHLANMQMESALTFSGYEVAHVWGEGAHNGDHATAIFPLAMRWLWKDYPKSIANGLSKNPFLNDMLVPNHNWELVNTDIKRSVAKTLTPDHSQLYQIEPNSHWIWIYNVQPNGKLTNRQRFGWLHKPDSAENAHPTAICCDRDGRLYVATNLGIQVLDQIGRVNAILPLPVNSGEPTELCFGGPDYNELYVKVGAQIFRRKLKVTGVHATDAPVKPPKPKL